MNNQRIFITGGSSGLGRALAKRYAELGWKVCIGDINQAQGEELVRSLHDNKVDAAFIYCDVTKENDLEKAANWIEANWGGVDVVVNNAGVTAAGGIADIPISDWQWIIEINLLGVVRGCKVFTPLFRRQRHGHFVNIASVAGFLNPAMSVPYNVCKAAVISLSETLCFELAEDNIAVSVVCPSFFRSNLAKSIRATNEHLIQVTKHLINNSEFDADDIARLIQSGIAHGEFLIIPQAKAIKAWRLKRYTPFRIFAWLVAKENKGFLTIRHSESKSS